MEPWFDGNMVGGILGSVFGILGGLTGTLMGTCAPRGKCRKLVYGLLIFDMASSVIMLVAGLVALFSGQPYGVWYPLLLCGALGTLLFPLFIPMARNAYMQAEARKLQAGDL